MKYFKNTELAKLYHISEKSVRNWIESAEAGKLELELYREGERLCIANTSKNTFQIEQLVQKGKKYKNHRGFKTTRPTTQFYKLYGSKEIADIVSNIDIHREIPHQYSYFNGGAEHWDLYSKKLLEDPAGNPLTKTIELLSLTTPYIDTLISEYKTVNVIDLGIGNSMPVRPLLQHLLDKNVLGRYVGIDTSKDMLTIADRNVHDWFGDRVAYEGHVRDIVYDRFDDLLLSDSLGGPAPSAVNLVLFLGATILNFRDPSYALRTINSSLGKNDLMFLSLKLDSERARRYFDFSAKGGGGKSLDLKEKAILDLLNIDESLYDVEQLFDQEKMEREILVRFKVALSMEFQVGDGQRVIDLHKGESIVLWRAKHQSGLETIEQLNRTGFDLMQATKSRDQEHLLIISKIKSGL